jgi:LPS-assembly protein
LFVFVLALAGATAPAVAQIKPAEREQLPRMSLPSAAETRRPVVINANELVFDRERGTVTARGNVMIFQGDRVLLADEVIYDRNADRVIATGNVAIVEPGGNTLFASRAELTRDMKEGLLEQFRLLFAEDSRLAANGAVRSEGNRTEMSRVVFSPCRLCAEDPTRPPFWQLKARSVVHDQTTSDITYRDAVLEMFGVPVFYTPWFRHPDPTVRRRSGFLTPIFGSESGLGQTLRTPYFWAIDRDRDATITPMITTGTGGAYSALLGEYRHRFPNGAFTADGSITYVRRTDDLGQQIDGHEFRGHLFGRFRYDIDANWRVGFDAGIVSDRTYLRRYDIFTGDTLVSTAWAEGFFHRDYASVRLYHFQTLRLEEQQDRLPYVLPLAEYFAVGPPGPYGRWHAYGALLGVAREDGPESRRASLTAGWRVPYTDRMGWVLTATASLNADLYWVVNNQLQGVGEFSGTQGRIYPQLLVDWRYPFVRELGNVRHVIEPRAAMVVTPPNLNTWKIPNEDSIDFEFDDTNLFAENRYPGRDRIDDGMRFVYGFSSNFYGNRGGKAEFFLGQSYRVFGEDNFLPNSGLDNNLSDVVGRVRLSPAHYLDFLWRFRFDVGGWESRRQEATIAVGSPPFRVGLSYLDFTDDTGSGEFAQRRQVRFAASSQITPNWALSGSAVVDLTAVEHTLQSWTILGEYKNDCCTITAGFSRRIDELIDPKPTNRFLFTIHFKYLGDVGTGRD